MVLIILSSVVTCIDLDKNSTAINYRNNKSMPKVIWEEGRVVALSHTYAV